MLIPIRTEQVERHTPWVNGSIILVNLVIFGAKNRLDFDLFSGLVLRPLDPSVPQFLTYAFVHGDLMHVLGNMVFLWVFGNAVEDKLGRPGYLAFYLAGAVLSGLAHALVEPNPVIGASGAVAAVTGAYLALYPMSRVMCLSIIGFFEIPSLYFIAFRLMFDVIGFLADWGGVAYMAHLGGYLMGFATGAALLYVKVLPRDHFDVVSLIRQQQRKASFKGTTVWDTPSGRWQAPMASGELTGKAKAIADARLAVAEALDREDLAAAGPAYQKLLELDPNQVLARNRQLDLANGLNAAGQPELSVRAYQRFLEGYPRDPERAEVALLMCVVLIRQLNRPADAIEPLREAVDTLRQDAQKELARKLLRQAEAAE